MKLAGAIDFNAPATDYARKDFPLLQSGASAEKALETIRREGVGERVIYFYAVDERMRLVGVVPTRRLLTAAPATPLHEIMVPRVIALPATATVLEACEFFVLYKFLAFPVVDAERRIIGVVDADVFMESVLETQGTEAEGLRSAQVTRRWFATAFRREIVTALLLAVACGVLVSAIVWFWRDEIRAALVIGGSIAVSLVTACLFGLCVPSLLHWWKLDPKISAGPVTLALADFFALLFYFTSAWLVLR
jgi:magnesium transporter